MAGKGTKTIIVRKLQVRSRIIYVTSVLVGTLILYTFARVRPVEAQERVADASTHVEATAVSLTPLSWNDTATTPSISPNICVNAQPEYKMAKFTAHVQPTGAVATVSVLSGPVSVSPSSVSEGTIVTATATGATTGPYVLKIASGTISSTAGGTVFSLLFNDNAITTGPTTPKTSPLGNSTFYASTGTVTPPRTFSTQVSEVLKFFSGPASLPTISQTADWQYQLNCVPSGAYAGKVGCPTTITATTPAGFVVAEAAASLTVGAVTLGASSASMTFTDGIAVTGLSGGNGATTPRTYTASAPTLVLVPFDLATCTGTSTWTNATAIYSVGTAVDAVDTISLSGARGGAAPVLGAQAGGVGQETGFNFTPGAFTLTK
jgi:hypothetical protein